VTGKDLQSKAFLPLGFFERLICKVFRWAQQTSNVSKEIRIFKVRGVSFEWRLALRNDLSLSNLSL
jgi:hypothetical protein